MISIGLASGDAALVEQYRHDLYFESAAMILTLITVGKTLEAYSKGRTTDALKSLMQLAPQTACVVRGGQEVTVPVAEVRTRRRVPGPPRREHPGGRRGGGRRFPASTRPL